jgi:dipeptidase E
MNIVAIGGGDVLAGETAAIDQVLVGLSGKAMPKLLFIPTASGDDEGYIQSIQVAYGRLGCEVNALKLWGRDVSAADARSIIEESDVIYVGGGNTKAMIGLWRELGVDVALRAFVNSGRPVGGLSAGALCWFRVGNSDWPQYENIPGVNTARLDCLGFVDLVLCPHTRDEGFRLNEFRVMMKGERGVGVGLDDGCAIQIRDDHYRILSSMEGSVGHLIYWSSDELAEQVIPPHVDFKPLASLQRGEI